MDAVLLTAAITAGMTSAIFASVRMFQRMRNLEQRIRELEEANTFRIPNQTINGLEDAIAVAFNAMRYQSATTEQLETLFELLRQVRGRENDPERPAGRKPKPEP